MNKIVLHIPHASINIPIKDGYVAPKDQLDLEILKLTDWYTDDLFESDLDDKIITPFSRIFCDVERFADDDKEVMSKFGMGVLYEKFDDGRDLRVVSSETRKTILDNYYWKHHNKLTELVSKHLELNNKCLIIDCHSFPSTPLKRALSQELNRPDFNIGTDKFHTPPKLIEASKVYFQELGYTLGIDWPYSGTITPNKYYNVDSRVNSIMLEVNRKLYLNEPTNLKSSSYANIKEVVYGFTQFIKSTYFN